MLKWSIAFVTKIFFRRSAQTVPVGQTSQSFLNGCLSWGISAIKLPCIKNCLIRPGPHAHYAIGSRSPRSASHRTDPTTPYQVFA